MPPQTNATLTAVRGAGVADDWDTAGSAGSAKWTGEARGYYRETTDRTAGAAGGLDVLERRELILDTAAVDAIAELDTDDVLTFTVDGAAAPLEATAKAIARRRLSGIPPTLQTTKITLEVS